MNSVRMQGTYLSLEHRLFEHDRSTVAAASPIPTIGTTRPPLPPLYSITARIDYILRRKGQVVLYGPPGTGKTYHALRAARELAARAAFRKSFPELTEVERTEITGATGLVRLCTFHPGYSYEDFIEGLRPRTVNGQMIFEPRDSIFKRICLDANRPDARPLFLVIDEINRGGGPRILRGACLSR